MSQDNCKRLVRFIRPNGTECWITETSGAAHEARGTMRWDKVDRCYRWTGGRGV